jgi:peptidoglycan/xylan/chitin deacetylase (PgdA/CDA1 family)
MGHRERLGTFLARTGGLGAILKARARLRLPVVSILTYHHICDPVADYPFDPDTADVTQAQFQRQMELVKRYFTVIDVDQLLIGLDDRTTLPPNPCLITFDDGYKSNLTVALPILHQLDLPAIFFIATSFVSERRLYWWDRIAWLVSQAKGSALQLTYPRALTVPLGDRGRARGVLNGVVKDEGGLDLERFLSDITRAANLDWSPVIERELADSLIMTWDEVRLLRDAGMNIESHTRHHRVLQTLGTDALVDELAGASSDLAREMGRPARVIAYPVGRSIANLPNIRTAVANAGYQLGMTNASGTVQLWQRLDRFDIGRIAVDRELSDDMFLAQLAIPQLAYTHSYG